MKLRNLRVAMILLLVLVSVFSYAQNYLNVSFSCMTSAGGYVRPDSITVENLDRGWKETLLYPDTVCQLNVETAVPVFIESEGLAAIPNPFDGSVEVVLTVIEEGDAIIEILDLSGLVIEHLPLSALQAGKHAFRITLTSPGTFVFVVRMNGKSSSIKLINTGHGGRNAIEYHGGLGTGYDQPILQKNNSPKDGDEHPFQLGDQMQYVGYSSGQTSAVVIHNLIEAHYVTLVFPTPCTASASHPAQTGTAYHGNGYEGADDGLETLSNGYISSVTDYEGNIYPVTQIGSQCWLAQNMRCTHSPNGYLSQTFNTSMWDAYCYVPSYPQITMSLEDRGMFYNWAGAMDTTASTWITDSFVGRQGICPRGWHIPCEEEWEDLSHYLSNQIAYQCGGVSTSYAKALASTSYWNNSTEPCAVGFFPETNNATGFSAIPSGQVCGTSYYVEGNGALFWSSTSYDGGRAVYYSVYANCWFVMMTTDVKLCGLSVRCLRD